MEGEIKNSLIGMKKIIEILLLVSLISFFTGSSFSQDKNDNSSKEKNENMHEKGSQGKTDDIHKKGSKKVKNYSNCSKGKIKDGHVKMMIRTAPKLTFEFSGYYGFGVFELSANDNGDFADEEFEEGENFGVRHGVGGNFVVKIPLHKRGNIRLDISGMFTKFDSKYSKAINKDHPSEFVTYNVYTGGVGIENNFTPNHKIKTLVGISVIGSVITGNANLYLNESLTEMKIKPAFRLGISVFSGLEYLLNDRIGMNFGFRFNHANLWLKDTKVSDNPNELYLNDKRVIPRIPYSGWRQFAWGSFYGGVNIYFGIRQKSYVMKKF